MHKPKILVPCYLSQIVIIWSHTESKPTANKTHEIDHHLRAQNDQEQQEYQGEEAPWRRLSKDEWQIKRKESKRKFKFAESGNWEKLWDDHHQCDYYYNTDTQEARWEKPDDYVDDDML